MLERLAEAIGCSDFVLSSNVAGTNKPSELPSLPPLSLRRLDQIEDQIQPVRAGKGEDSEFIFDAIFKSPSSHFDTKPVKLAEVSLGQTSFI